MSQFAAPASGVSKQALKAADDYLLAFVYIKNARMKPIPFPGFIFKGNRIPVNNKIVNENRDAYFLECTSANVDNWIKNLSIVDECNSCYRKDNKALIKLNITAKATYLQAV